MSLLLPSSSWGHSNSLLPPGRYVSGGEYLVDYCPSCGKKNHFYWNASKVLEFPDGTTATGAGICHSCKFRVIGQRQFARVFNGNLTADISPVQPKVQVKTNLNKPSLWTCSAWDHPRSQALMLERRLPEELVRKVGIGYLEEEDAVTLRVDPVSPEYPEGYLYRRLSGKLQKWIPVPGTTMSMYGFGLRFLKPELKAIVITEGTFDVLSSGLLGYAVAVCGSAADMNWISWIRQNFKAVAIWFDPDDAGVNGANKLSAAFNVWGVNHKIISHPIEPKYHCPQDNTIIDLKKKLELV